MVSVPRCPKCGQLHWPARDDFYERTEPCQDCGRVGSYAYRYEAYLCDGCFQARMEKGPGLFEFAYPREGVTL
jgi:ribosomal protein S14